MKKIIIAIMLVIILAMYCRNLSEVIIKNQRKSVESTVNKMDEESIKEILLSSKDKIVVVDAGHGGIDPGKVGVHNELEKDINLSMAYKLKDKLIESGFSVLMTRTEDEGLYNAYDKNKKVSDLKKRVEIINTSEAICVVSIHQNSFTTNKERGAQVFYYTSSMLSKDLAMQVQSSLNKSSDNNNKRIHMSNSSYYILKKTYKPIIIAECGFLSNEIESQLLITDEYQNSIVSAICQGIINWANGIIENDI